ncbi:MAG: DUF1294 domain-containing protein [Methylophilaceae bacterium]
MILWLYVVASLLAFVMYGLDKAAARDNRQRVSEQTLQFLALIGGWPGALIAQKVFRHKSRKVKFQRVFWVTVSINCVVFFWLLSQRDQDFVKAIFV